jgi:hypothetical protein
MLILSLQPSTQLQKMLTIWDFEALEGLRNYGREGDL